MDLSEKRRKWREWSKARKERMTPEELAADKAKKYAEKLARYSTPEGREKRRAMERRWRAANQDRVRASREREKEKRRQKTAEARAARLADPAYQKALEEKRAASKEKTKQTYTEYYARRRARQEADPELMEKFRERQRQYRRNKVAATMADPETRAAYLAGLITKKAKPRVELTDKEKEDLVRRKREAMAKAQRARQAQQRAERERREAEAAERRAQQPPPRPAPPAPVKKMGRFTALSKWYGY